MSIGAPAKSSHLFVDRLEKIAHNAPSLLEGGRFNLQNKEQRMNAKTPVIFGMLSILLLAAAVTPAQDVSQDSASPTAVQPAPAGGDFEPAGRSADESAPAGKETPATAPGDSRGGNAAKESDRNTSPLGDWMPLLLIGGFLVLWIFLGRSRRKQEAKRRAMLENLSKGDRVVTIGGVIGTIVEVRDSEIVVKVDDNTRMKFARWAVRNVGEGVEEEKKKDTQE